MASLIAGLAMGVWTGPGRAGGNSSVSSIAEREVQRRQVLINQAQTQLTEADDLLARGKPQDALTIYGQVYQSLPENPMTRDVREQARQGFATAACRQAEKLMGEARYPEARGLIDQVLDPGMAPDHKEAASLRKKFADPDRYPPALTPTHLANAQKVAGLLTQAASYVDLGDLDSANKTYQAVLRIDPNNSAARRGMERVEQEKARYYEAARDHRRAKALAEIDKLWEDPVPPSATELSAIFGAGQAARTSTQGRREEITQMLRKLIVPKVDFSGASLEEVVEFLRVRSRDLDPKGRGLNFILQVPPESQNRPVSLSLSQVPLEEILRYATEMSGTVFKVDEQAVVIGSISENATTLITKTYRVPPGFLQTQAVGDQGAANAPADPFAQQPAAGAGGGLQIRRMGAKEFLESRGVTFGEGSGASYNAATNLLIVRNTAPNLEVVDMLVEQAQTSSPKQVLISVKMLEINDRKLQEMGFDWLMSPFNVPGSNGVFMSGGTAGNQQSSDFVNADFPLKDPSGISVGQFPLTSGLRSSGAILAVPSINTLLGENKDLPSANSRSPGQIALSGVMTDPQFQVVMRAMNQDKGVDIAAVPSVLAKSGQKVSIEIAREFPYPTEFDPAQVPQSVGQYTIGNTRISTGNNSAPVVPSTPTTFEVRKVGTLLEAEPVISDNGREVELSLTPEIVEFEGFIDYQSDIDNRIQLPDGSIQTVRVDNRVIQPIFRTNKVTTAVKVWDGATIVIGGVIEDRKTNINDKIPVIGDIPIVGRFWKSQVSNVETKNVVFFVSVRVIDPAGQPVNQVNAVTSASSAR